MADIPPYPLYNRTYSLYRLSPLHHGDAPLLDDGALRAHAHRLREQLTGDSVRGVQVDFAGADETARLGPLDRCRWHALGDEDAWIDRHRQSPAPDASPLPALASPARVRGVEVSLEYERQSYNALLLRDPGAPSSPGAFTALPLLLVKMPGPVRDVFLRYLQTAFDAHVAPLRLPSAFLTSSLETYFHHLSSPSSTQSIPDVIRQLQIQLSFPTTTSLLRHIDITIAGSDVAGFVSRGSHTKPFTAALSRYLQQHLALDIAHPKVHISKISCNSFHLGAERLKLVAPDTLPDTSFSDEEGASQDASAGQLAVQDFISSLVREATGTGKFLPGHLTSDQRDETPSSAASAKAGPRKRAVSNAAAGNGNQKKAKAREKENGRQVNGDGDVVDV